MDPRAEHRAEERPLAGDVPQLEIDRPARPREHVHDAVPPGGADGHDRLVVAPVERVRDSQERDEPAHEPELARRQILEVGAVALGRAAPVVARDQRDEEPLAVGEAGDVGAGDEVEGVLVVAGRRDGVADVVEERRRLEQAARARGEPVQVRELVEQVERETRRVARVRLVEVEAAPERERGRGATGGRGRRRLGRAAREIRGGSRSAARCRPP